MIEVLLLSIQSSSTGPNNLELPYDLVQLIHPGQIVKLKPRTNILLDTGETFLMMPEKTGLLWQQSLHSTIIQDNFTTEKTPYELVFGTKPQIPMSLKLGLYRITNFAVQIFVHTENNSRNELLDNLLQPPLSQAPLERERTFKQLYSSTFERRREQTARSDAYRNRFRLGHHLEVGQKALYENHKQDLTPNQKLQQQRLGPSTVTKRITNATYEIQDDKDPTAIKTVHRKHLVEFYPKEGSLPAMLEEYAPPDHQNHYFYERFMEQRTRDLNNASTTEEHDSFPFLIEPLRSFSSTNKPK